MSKNFDRVRDYLLDLNLAIIGEDEAEELLVVSDEESGINHLIVDVEDPILVLEQLILEMPEGAGTNGFFRRLLQMNRTLVHGAYVLDEEGRRVIFRDTLQLENLDPNELEGSIQALSLAMAEHGSELLEFVHAAAR
ncbi:MAG: molecular chaperone Tir [Gemmatimonas sp.]|nr:molecular chaperone Tir [Gemmatimonas sp.]